VVTVDATLLWRACRVHDEGRTLLNLIGAGANAVQTNDPFRGRSRRTSGSSSPLMVPNFDRAVNIQIEIVGKLGRRRPRNMTLIGHISRAVELMCRPSYSSVFSGDLSGLSYLKKGCTL